jgi:PPOX class probable F420-dependent enzyme
MVRGATPTGLEKTKRGRGRRRLPRGRADERFLEAELTSGRAAEIAELPSEIRRLLDEVRRAVMTTMSAEGTAHSVPVVFVVLDNEILSPIDHKPKLGQKLARVRNLERDDRVTLLADRWDEEWTRLGWLMVQGTAVVDENASLDDMRALNSRYPQYEPDERHDALIRIRPHRLLWWTWD